MRPKTKRSLSLGRKKRPEKQSNRARLHSQIIVHSCDLINENHVSDCQACKHTAAGNALLHPQRIRINKTYPVLPCLSILAATGGLL